MTNTECYAAFYSNLVKVDVAAWCQSLTAFIHVNTAVNVARVTFTKSIHPP